ncbi:hypothetical protein LINGRAHAP2_LOCUS33604 [Linum grandiflorum]
MADILLRLRVKDLVNCRRVSKLWLSIIDDPHFIDSQLECALSNPSNSTLFLHEVGRIGYEQKACGFGYDELLDDYKFVSILETRSDDPHNMNPSYTAEIYPLQIGGTTFLCPWGVFWQLVALGYLERSF